MRIVDADRNTVVLTASRHEITTIVAAARMALELIEADVGAPPEARDQLARVIRDYDAAFARAVPTYNGSTPVGPEQGDAQCT
jgi:hypothetical protein